MSIKFIHRKFKAHWMIGASLQKGEHGIWIAKVGFFVWVFEWWITLK